MNLISGRPCLCQSWDAMNLNHTWKKFGQVVNLFQRFNSYKNESLSSPQRLLEFQNDQVRARNYAGFIFFQDLEVQIFPKIFSSSKMADVQLLFRHLNYYLNYCHTLKLPYSTGDFEHLSEGSLFDLWLNTFVFIVWQYTQQSSHFVYEEKIESTLYFKGRLDNAQYIHKSLNKANWHRPFQLYHSWTFDNSFNQLLKYIFTNLRNSWNNRALQNKIEEVLWALNDCKYQYFSLKDCQRLYAQTTDEDQKLIIFLCEIFLLNENSNAQKLSKPYFSFLLPMEGCF